MRNFRTPLLSSPLLVAVLLMSACGSPDDGETTDPRSASTPSAEGSASENSLGPASAEPNYDNVPEPKTPVDETPQEFEKDGLGVYDLEFVMKPEADLSAFSEDGESSWGRGPHKAADGRMVVSSLMPGMAASMFRNRGFVPRLRVHPAGWQELRAVIHQRRLQPTVHAGGLTSLLAFPPTIRCGASLSFQALLSARRCGG